MHTKLISRTFRSTSLATLLAATFGTLLSGQTTPQTPAPAPQAVPCNELPNGSFGNGFARWNLTPSTGEFGDTRIYASAAITNSTIWGSVEDSAYLHTSVFVDGVDPNTSGSAGQAQFTLSQSVLLTHRTLAFSVEGGGYGACIFGAPSALLTAKVVVTNAAGVKAEQTLINVRPSPQPLCTTGICFTGILAREDFLMDLVGAGFSKGQRITIELILSVTMASTDPCSYGDLSGAITIDDFRLCDTIATVSSPPRILQRSLQVPSLSEAQWLGAMSTEDYGQRYRTMQLLGAPLDTWMRSPTTRLLTTEDSLE